MPRPRLEISWFFFGLLLLVGLGLLGILAVGGLFFWTLLRLIRG